MAIIQILKQVVPCIKIVPCIKNLAQKVLHLDHV